MSADNINSYVYILTNTLKSGGAEKQSIYLARSILAHYDVTLIVYYGDQFDQRMTALLEDAKDRVLWLKGNHLTKFYKLFRLFRRNRNSVIISYLATTNLINAIIGTLAGVNVKIGGIRNSKHTKLKLSIQKILHNRLLTAIVFNNTKGFTQLTINGFRPEKSYLIYNGIDIKRNPKSIQDRSKINILTVSRFMPQKDYQTAFRAVAQVIQECQKISIKYLIVGHGILEQKLKTLARSLGIDHHLEFIINPPEVDLYYKQADIYLSTSLFEGLSNSIMEAMLYNLPVVATDVGDNNKLVLEGHTGYLLSAKDTKGLADKLTELVKDADMRHFLGVNGFSHLRDNFSLEKMTEEYVTLIETLLHENKA